MIQHNFGINFKTKNYFSHCECQGNFRGEMRAVTMRSWYLGAGIAFSDVNRKREKDVLWVPVTWHLNKICKLDDDDDDDGDYSQTSVHLHISLSSSLQGDKYEIA